LIGGGVIRGFVLISCEIHLVGAIGGRLPDEVNTPIRMD
jgi:hypothetical protein